LVGLQKDSHRLDFLKGIEFYFDLSGRNVVLVLLLQLAGLVFQGVAGSMNST
jgi:hypothetical protein